MRDRAEKVDRLLREEGAGEEMLPVAWVLVVDYLRPDGERVLDRLKFPDDMPDWQLGGILQSALEDQFEDL